ncbi:hypothetical protein ACQPXT_03110 [Streptomyces sp. CA-100214]
MASVRVIHRVQRTPTGHVRAGMSVENNTVNTVLGPVPAEELGVVSVHGALLSVVPGAEYAFDVTLDRAEIFETLAARLKDFRAHGGGTVVDSTGMFHGRDVRLYEALARTTGVHIVASTGQGPEEMLGGYFLTPRPTRRRPGPPTGSPTSSPRRSPRAWSFPAWSAAAPRDWWPPPRPVRA